jgi:hypothetical protein
MPVNQSWLFSRLLDHAEFSGKPLSGIVRCRNGNPFVAALARRSRVRQTRDIPKLVKEILNIVPVLLGD